MKLHVLLFVHRRTHKCTICKEQLSADDAATHYRTKHSKNKNSKPSQPLEQPKKSNFNNTSRGSEISQEINKPSVPSNSFIEVNGSFQCRRCPAKFLSSKSASNHFLNKHSDQPVEPEKPQDLVREHQNVPTKTLDKVEKAKSNKEVFNHAKVGEECPDKPRFSRVRSGTEPAAYKVWPLTPVTFCLLL